MSGLQQDQWIPKLILQLLPSPRMCDGDKYNQKLAESMTCGATASLVGKTKWKIQELPLPGKTVDQNQCCIPGENDRNEHHCKNSKMQGQWLPHLSLILLSGLCRPWRMPADLLNEVQEYRNIKLLTQRNENRSQQLRQGPKVSFFTMALCSYGLVFYNNLLSLTTDNCHGPKLTFNKGLYETPSIHPIP